MIYQKIYISPLIYAAVFNIVDIFFSEYFINHLDIGLGEFNFLLQQGNEQKFDYVTAILIKLSVFIVIGFFYIRGYIKAKKPIKYEEKIENLLSEYTDLAGSILIGYTFTTINFIIVFVWNFLIILIFNINVNLGFITVMVLIALFSFIVSVYLTMSYLLRFIEPKNRAQHKYLLLPYKIKILCLS